MNDKDKIRLGIIGITGRGKLAVIWDTDEPRAVIAGGMDLHDDALRDFQEAYGPDVLITKNADELIESPDIDAIAVMSPDWTHEGYVIKAFEAGKHVFCEKPMAISIDGCDRMLEAWKKSGKKFMVGFNMRYMNMFRTMKDIVDSGTIGEIKNVWCRHFVGFGGEVYYHDWHANSKYSNGLLLQKASHDIDMIHWIAGEYTEAVCGMGGLDYYGGDKPNGLTCPRCDEKDICPEFQTNAKTSKDTNQMEMCVFRKEVDVEDNSSVLMRLNGGIKAVYMQCHFAPETWRNYTFIGTEGRMENVDKNSKVIVKLRDHSKRTQNLADRVYDVKQAKGGHGGADPLVCKDFIDMILSNTRPVATPLAGRMSVAAGCAATESIRNNSELVEIPPVPKHLQGFVF